MRKLYSFLYRSEMVRLPAAENHDIQMALGKMHLVLSNIPQAEAAFSRAHAFVPSEQSARHLSSIRKRRLEKSLLADRRFAARRAAQSIVNGGPQTFLRKWLGCD
jgi:hypothetical protein